MKIAYARTSTVDQQYGFESQLEELAAYGCEKEFKEQVSSVAQRDQLEAAIEFCREGDSLVVTKLDRLARNVGDLNGIIARLEAKGVALVILNLNLDTSTPTGKLMLNLLGSIGQFEREIMLERQKEGIAKAKADGKYKGRKPTAQAKSKEVMEMVAGGLKPSQIAKELNIGVASVYRIRNAAKEGV